MIKTELDRDLQQFFVAEDGSAAEKTETALMPVLFEISGSNNRKKR